MVAFYTNIQLNAHSTVYGSTLIHFYGLTVEYSNRPSQGSNISPDDFGGRISFRDLSAMTFQTDIQLIMVHPLSPHLDCFFPSFSIL